MPYKIFRVTGGYKVGKEDGSIMGNGRRYASNKPLTRKKAEAQMKAMVISEGLRSPFSIPEKTSALILTVTNSKCHGEGDKKCDLKSSGVAKDIFEKARDGEEGIIEENDDIVHHVAGTNHLLIAKSHHYDCEENEEVCRMKQKGFFDKLNDLVKGESRAGRKVSIFDIHTHDKGEGGIKI